MAAVLSKWEAEAVTHRAAVRSREVHRMVRKRFISINLLSSGGGPPVVLPFYTCPARPSRVGGEEKFSPGRKRRVFSRFRTGTGR